MVVLQECIIIFNLLKRVLVPLNVPLEQFKVIQQCNENEINDNKYSKEKEIKNNLSLRSKNTSM